MKILSKINHFKNLIFKKKYRWYWVFAVVAVIIIWFIFFRGGAEVETIVVHPGEFLQQISVSGKLIATEDIDLSFEQSGQIRSIYVKEGDSVKQGKLLAGQDISQLSAQLSETRAGISLQEAKLNQLLAGSSSEDILIAEDKVASAQQDLDNAYSNSLEVLNSAYFAIYNANSSAFSVQSNYFSTADQYGIKVFISRQKIESTLLAVKPYIDIAKLTPTDSSINEANNKVIDSLNVVYNELGVIREQCDLGVYFATIPSATKTTLDTHKTNINTALINLKSSIQDISSYKIALQKSKNELSLVKAPARPSDIGVYQAQIDQAKASEQNILAQLRKRQIYSPIDGVITNVNVKLGSIFGANNTAVSIISADPLEIESYVPEIYVSLISVNDPAEITLDAYGEQTKFQARVVSIDPAETIKDGVATYRTKLQFDGLDERLRSGMSANVVVLTEKKENVISVPQGVVKLQSGKKFVMVQSGKDVVEREVQTGLVSSLGQIEITSGLQDGDIVIIK